jgi:hypothetical protein
MFGVTYLGLLVEDAEESASLGESAVGAKEAFVVPGG